MNTIAIAILIGVLAVIGTVHFPLTNDMLRELCDEREATKSRIMPVETVKSYKEVLIFIAMSNGAVMFIMSLIILYSIHFLLLQLYDEFYFNPFVACVPIYISIIAWFYMAERIAIDFRSRIGKKTLKRWFPEEGTSTEISETYFYGTIIVATVLSIALVVSFCYQLIEIFFLAASILILTIWFSSLLFLRPLTNLFMIRQVSRKINKIEA